RRRGGSLPDLLDDAIVQHVLPRFDVQLLTSPAGLYATAPLHSQPSNSHILKALDGTLTVKAVVRHVYGSPDVLQLQEVERPVMGDDDVLVEILAASVNASDWEHLIADPVYVRLVGFGLRKPKHKILGSDIAGRVEAVGKNVTQFRPGDEVLADTLYHGLGGFAEYVSVPEDGILVKKPAGIPFEEAATLPQAGAIALKGIRDKGRVRPGQKVLINGAGGGAGTFAVQLAKSLGAEVTAVDRGSKLDMLRKLGADHVVDFEREDFTRQDRRYDLILDVAAHRSIFDHKRVLARDGMYGMVGGGMGQLFQAVLLGPLISMAGGKKMGLMAVPISREQLASVIELVEAGKMKPVIDRRYPLSEVPEALRYLGEGRSLGKLVITGRTLEQNLEKAVGVTAE
ncbi:MAG: NAD(P)-dependent alcohol dehydrogenase, partial [Acidimicrobiia bacterium]